MAYRRVAVIVASISVLTGCGAGTPRENILTSGGSTFAQNMVEACRRAYYADDASNPTGIAISYSATGSGTGRTNFKNGTFDFALTDSAYKSNAPSDFIYVPMVAGPIAIAYRLDGVVPESATVQMSANTLAKVLAGQITRWDDEELVADNPDISLPDTGIRVAYRAGNSGTTSNLTKYLTAASPSVWSNDASDDFTSAFPGTLPTDGTFQAASGSDGVTNYAADNDGSITYAELSYVTDRSARGLRALKVANNTGEYVAPSAQSTATFYANAEVTENGLAKVDYATEEPGAYLINAISYGLISTKKDLKNSKTRMFFEYVLNSCAPNQGAELGYAPLTGAIRDKANQLLDSVINE